MAKYKIGDYVLYGFSGACQVVEIGPLSFGGPDKLYYSLKPVYDSRSTIYVPLNKEDEIVRKVITKPEAEEVLEKITQCQPDNMTFERDACEEVLKSGDNVEVSRVIKQLRNLRKENRKSHKGLNISEERILRDAERIFFSEIATAFEMTMEDTMAEFSARLDD
ncbi:MAG: hypothetical protein K2J95_06435 [Lachnospiraceae bacterium]|nr:hypothetical protein [Lachnospiraceae bacterium]MDE6743497.1 hypothetical protein [Lachnospiraceae bacterium]